MPTEAFLTTCRSAVALLPELATFRAAGTVTDASTRAERRAAWHTRHSPVGSLPSLANRLRKTIRDVVNAEADKQAATGSGVVATADRESAYQTLIAEFVPIPDRPRSDPDELAALQAALDEDALT